MTIFDKIKNTNVSFDEYGKLNDTTPDVVINPEDTPLNYLRTIPNDGQNQFSSILQEKADALRYGAKTSLSLSGVDNLYADNVMEITNFDYWANADYGKGNFLPEDIIDDSFRYVAQKFWNIQEGNSLAFLKKGFESNAYVPFSISIDEAGTQKQDMPDGSVRYVTTVMLTPDKKKFVVAKRGQEFNLSDYYPIELDNVTTTLITNPSPFLTALSTSDEVIGFVPDIWKNYLTSKDRFNIAGRPDVYWDKIINFNKKYYDMPFVIDTPVQKSISDREKYCTAESQYNYYHRSFEEVSALDSVDENYMPNLYANYAAKNNTQSIPEKLIDINTLYKKMDNVLKAINNNNGVVNLFDYYEIFNEWSNKVGNLSTEERKNLKDMMSHVVLQNDDILQNVLEKVSAAENTFPGSIKLEFTGDPVGEVKRVFTDSNSVDKLINAVCNFDIAVDSFGKQIGSTVNFAYDQNSDTPVMQRELKSYPLDRFVEYSGGDSFFLDTNTYQEIKDSITFNKTEINSISDKAQSITSQIGQIVNSAIIKGKLKTLMTARGRTATQIMSGVPCYSDTVFYKIQKFKVSNNSTAISTPMQTTYIPATDESIITYFDTQVKYRNKYRYKIHAFVAVFGAEYEYLSMDSSNNVVFDDDNNAFFKISIKPIVKLLEVPYSERDCILYDLPPTSPSVEFIPYAGKKDIKISLSTTFGETLEVPVQVLRQDEKPIFYSLQRQEPDSLGRIRYSGDDSIARFQVFRLESRPTAPTDFALAPVRYVDNSTPDRPSAHTREVSFNETLAYNTKYYYMFRSVDVHQNISNPSRIFEVEVVNNDGAVYTVVRNVDYLTPVRKFKTKNVRKYIRIRASVNQKNFDAQNVVDNFSQSKLSNVKIGPKNNNMWNRKFKFRLTSNDTGRKIDINVKFAYDVKGYEFQFVSGVTGQPIIIQADSFTEALQLLLIEQNIDLI